MEAVSASRYRDGRANLQRKDGGSMAWLRGSRDGRGSDAGVRETSRRAAQERAEREHQEFLRRDQEDRLRRDQNDAQRRSSER